MSEPRLLTPQSLLVDVRNNNIVAAGHVYSVVSPLKFW
jgi:hypothetical protein